MDISSQSNGNYFITSSSNNGSHHHHHHHQNNGGINSNSSNNLGNIKALLASPIAAVRQNNQLGNCLRVVHQKRPITISSSNYVATAAIPNSSGDQNSITTATAAAAAVAASTTGNDRIPNVPINSGDSIFNSNNELVLLPSNNAAPLLGERYLLLNQISGSSFYECLDIRSGDVLACKAVGNSYSKILSAYFRLDGDPHVKPLYKLLKSADQTYLLLPPSQYGDLHSYVRERKRLNETEARHLFRQICKTVKSCHQQGIVLRDLKLRKFVFSDLERTYLKFESLEDAVVLDDPDNDILKEKIGCPAYVAPEILKPNSDFSGKAADLWSLGVILYTMLVGRYPFNDPEHSSLFAKIARCQFKIPEDISSKARCLIKSLLQRVPKHRITSDDILHHPWLQEDNRFNHNSSNSSSNNNNSSNNSSSSSNGSCNDLSTDDQCVPDMDCIDFT